MGGRTLKVVSRDRSESFVADVRAGRPFIEALKDGREPTRHPAVAQAALEMLQDSGAIDMKQLATAAGMSRASLYRYYPDRREVIGEIAALGVSDMVLLAAVLSTTPDRIREIGGYMLTHPAHAAAMREMVEFVATDALDAVAEQLVGSAMYAPWLIGLAAMCAPPGMTEQDIARVQCHIEEMALLADA